jgi:arylsulfatase
VQAPREYIDRYKDAYEKGWDVIRSERFARQKALGIIPKDAVLTPRDPSIPAWDTLTPAQQKVFARYMAVYAGFLEHADAQIGRLTEYLKSAGQYDNTVIVFMSDNGPTIEGGPNGRFAIQSPVTTVDQMLARLDEIGGPTSSPTYPRGWAPVGAAPFAKWKNTLYAGGVRAPLIVSWASGIRDRGAVRDQFVEVQDITPTVLDIAGIRPPDVVDGVKQLEMAGRSIRPTFTDRRAKTRDTQILLLGTSRAIRSGGWKAVSTHTPGTSFDADKWELFHTDEDYSEAIDVADRYPGKLKELQGRWQTEAERLGALPLVEGGRGRRGQVNAEQVAAAHLGARRRSSLPMPRSIRRLP